MTELGFHTDRPIPYFDKSLGISLMLNVDMTVETDDAQEHQKSNIPFYAEISLNEVLSGYGGDVPFEELSEKYDDIGTAVSRKLTEKMNLPCSVRINKIQPDERSQKFLEDIKLTRKMSDPAFAAAELEKALKKAQETAEKNGMSPEDIKKIQNMPLPEFPPLPDTDDPLDRARAITARVDQMKQAAMNAPLVAAMDVQPPPRPKYCANCGSALPETGNFCPDCGSKI